MPILYDDSCGYVYSAEVCVDYDRQAYSDRTTVLRVLPDHLHSTVCHGTDAVNGSLFRPV